MRPLGSSAGAWPVIANLLGLVFVCALGGSATAQECVSPCTCRLNGEVLTCNLNGAVVTFTSLSGKTTYTNSKSDTNATLRNIGPPSTFLGVIEDGGPAA